MPTQLTNRKLNALAQLTLESLQLWAEENVVLRGWDYHNNDQVSDLGITPDGELLSWVHGTERYATRVYWDENGALQSACSCPYGEKCKHAVATILTYAKMKAADQVVPKTRRNDKRLRLSAVASMGEMDFDFGAANLDVSASTKTPPTDPRAFMQSLPAERLLALLEELMESIPEAARYLESVMMRDSRDTSALLAALRKEMVRVCGEAEDWEPGGRYGTPAGFDHVRELMENLIAAGGVDELAEYGELFMQQVSDLVAEYHYHDDLRAGAEDCVPLVLKAVKKSSMSPTWRLIWALDILLDDEYEMAGVIGDYVEGRHPKEAWNAAAEHLLDRLEELPKGSAKRYLRHSHIGLITMALERSRRANEITEVLEREAQTSGLWALLVEHLIAEGRDADAEDRILKGIAAIGEEEPGTAAHLRGLLKKVRSRTRDWSAVGALQAQEFVDSPSESAFQACRTTAKKAKCWDQVRQALLIHLETGKLPWKQEGWPLGKPLVSSNDRRGGYRKTYPDCHALVSIAILERDPQRILQWWDRREKNRWSYGGQALEVANAVRRHAPERSVEIWKTLAEDQIRQTKPSAYQVAGQYLRRAGQAMQEIGKAEDWAQFLDSLRETHRRKRKLMEVLDKISSQE